MRTLILYLTVLLLFFRASAGVAQSAELPQRVVLAATEWCPYSCANQARANGRRGIVVEYLEKVFTSLGVELEVQFYPWSRAVLLARRGESVHGLVSSVRSEAPGMLFTQVPTMSYRTCVFTHADSTWEYSSPQSLSELRLGYIQDYGYGGFVDEYIREHQGQDNLMRIAGTGGVLQLSRILKAKRIDAFVSDPFVAIYELRGVDARLKMSACFEEFPFYLPLSPRLPWAQSLVERLDDIFQQESSQAILDDMIAEYLATEILD